MPATGRKMRKGFLFTVGAIHRVPCAATNVESGICVAWLSSLVWDNCLALSCRFRTTPFLPGECPANRRETHPGQRRAEESTAQASAALSPATVPAQTNLKANRVLNAGCPINRHSRAGGNPNPRRTSYPEPKEALPRPRPQPFRPNLCAES